MANKLPLALRILSDKLSNITTTFNGLTKPHCYVVSEAVVLGYPFMSLPLTGLLHLWTEMDLEICAWQWTINKEGFLHSTHQDYFVSVK